MNKRTSTTRTSAALWNRKFGGVFLGLTAGLSLLSVPEPAQAQEIHLTGPLAGAPAVRELRLYRQGRFEISPAATFTLLDEYQRHILLGARLNYNIVDWFAIGGWGGFAPGFTQIPTALSDHIQDVNAQRKAGDANSLDNKLTAVNLGADFKDQLGAIDWIASPQVTFIPFRGKLALFESIFLDTDLYLYGGPAFIGLKERAECSGTCTDPASFERVSRTAITVTGGFGFSFYATKWSAVGFEYRLLPFAWNRGGFDTAGGGKDEAFPDNNISSADRQFEWKHMLTLSFNILLPTAPRVSE